MKAKDIYQEIEKIKADFEGEIFTDNITRILYSTDASAYREKPIAVLYPKTNEDVKTAIALARTHHTHIIPRGAGTSLAGQVVGSGIVIDTSKFMNNIIELNAEEKWIRVQPGVVTDEVNKHIKPYGLIFGPETSTSNRCTMGGMLGNNSCGSYSVVYGSTREHTLEVKAILSDGSEATFGRLTKDEFRQKCAGDTLENKIYNEINNILSNEENKAEITKEFPDPTNPRKNTGYALDILSKAQPFGGNEIFNFCNLIAGSEGTLAFVTEIKFNLVDIPPKAKAVVCAHFESINEALRGNLIALKHKPMAVELMDKIILDCTKDSLKHQKNRFFIKDDPKALLIIEFAKETYAEIEEITKVLNKDFIEAKLGYHFPLIKGEDIPKVWELRKAGLGLLSNVPGDKRSTTVIEDTSVKVDALPTYIEELNEILKKHNLNCVHYGHAGSGELHLRPLLNLKDENDLNTFYNLALDVAKLVKKHKGSLSGEHGDGRLRGEFIPLMVGKHNYQLLKKVKKTWDPHSVFNIGKITDTPSIKSNLRYSTGEQKEIRTIFDFSKTLGFLRAIEKCTGSADCRKSAVIGGVMCPSFKATGYEHNSPRARANIMREIITYNQTDNPVASDEIYQLLDLCLSCKACKAECPSSVDITKLKAEFLQQHYLIKGIPLRTQLIANIGKINKMASIAPWLANFVFTNELLSGAIKKILGFAPKRNIPKLSKQTITSWYKKNQNTENKKTVYLFCDEFTNYNESDLGIKTIMLLRKMGYNVVIPNHAESARAYISKGLIIKAKEIANKNIDLLKNIVTDQTPLVGIEPSAILSFKDEYIELAEKRNNDAAKQLAKNTFLIDEFLVKEINAGLIKKEWFTNEKRHFKLHGHCHQKTLITTQATKKLLSFPENYSVEEIASGCCGMAGSFGFEKEHYDLSMKIGELTLFPEVRKTPKETTIVAPGTSCRQQIKDGTGVTAIHPVEVLFDALILK